MKIKCQTCNAEYEIAPEKIPPGGGRGQCKQCGGVIEVRPRGIVREEAKGTDAPSYNEIARRPGREAPPGRGAGSHGSSQGADALRLFVGEKYDDYYGKKFRRFSEGKGSITWNWAAFFFGPMWFLYRRMYLLGGLLFLLALFLNLPPLQFFALALALCIGLFGNVAYYKHAVRRIKNLNEESFTVQSRLTSERLRSAGGVNKWACAVPLGFFFIGIVSAVAVPQFAAYRERAMKAEEQSRSEEVRRSREATDGGVKAQSSTLREAVDKHTDSGYSLLLSGDVDAAMKEAVRLDPEYHNAVEKLQYFEAIAKASD